MSFASFIYRQGLVNRGQRGFYRKVHAKVFLLLRDALLRFADPDCRMDVCGKSLLMPLSHQLPFYLSREPHYDSSLRRITDAIRASDGYLCGIDVGANIGDTVAMCLNDKCDKFLAIEPNPAFFRYLAQNLRHFKDNVVLSKAPCTANDEHGSFRFSAAGGTATLQRESSGTAMGARSLDSLVSEFSEFQKCNFLKVDTDGYDFEVLRGGRNLILRNKPAVIFECQVFDDPRYVDDVLKTLSDFSAAGYRHVLAYDNYGNLFSALSLNDPAALACGLFYQVAGDRCYFDLLVMKDAGAFLASELDHFIHSAKDPVRRENAGRAADLIKARVR